MAVADTPLYIAIADLVTAVSVDDAAVADRLRRRYADFLCAPTTPHVAVNLTVVPGASFIPLRPGASWEVRVATADGVTQFVSYLEQGWFDLTAGVGQLTLAPHGEIENYLRVLYARLCLRHDALLLHAAGVLRNGEGYLFFGPSGAGKSTVARLSAEAGALPVSDDIVIVRRRGEELLLCGVPFLGELTHAVRRNAQAPLRAIFSLQQATRHAVRPLPRPLAVAGLAAAAPFVHDDPALGAALLRACARLATQLPPRTLYFARNPAFWEVIDGVVAALP